MKVADHSMRARPESARARSLTSPAGLSINCTFGFFSCFERSGRARGHLALLRYAAHHTSWRQARPVWRRSTAAVETLDEYLAALASERPTPGGGSAAALT